ncbi:MAG: hypothetical protein DELT_02822 [Desulfovibrio sp.]
MSGNDAVAAARIQLQAKSMVAGILLTLLFGGLGVFYVSIFWGILCTLFEIVLLIIAILTLGYGFALILPAHFVFALLVAVLVSAHNRRLLRALDRIG